MCGADFSTSLLSCPAEDIDISGTWLFWRREPEALLRQSLLRRGQLCPVLIDAGGSRPVLVAGLARVICLAEAGRNVLCRDLGVLDAWERGMIYLESNARPEIDDGRAVRALRYFQAVDASRLAEVFVALGLDPRMRRVRQLVTWLDLPEKWDEVLGAGHIPLVCVDALHRMDAAEQEALFPFFQAFSWSRGNAVNLLTWLRETSLREKQSVIDMAAAAQKELSPDLSPKDAMARITAEVRRLRYPALSALERNFTEAAGRVSAGTDWRLVQPDQFESGAVEMSVRLRFPADVRRAARQLADMAGADWSGIFSEDEA
jgi:ParB family chromosome partitioning protein